MSTNSNFNQEVYAKNQPLIIGAPVPIISPFNNTGVGRAPTTKDFAPLGTLWLWKPQNLAYILVSVVANVATWLQVTSGGGAGAFTTLTSTGNTALASGTGSTFAVGNTTGTITIGGAAQTGAVNVGNSSGTVTVGIGNGTGANAVNIGSAGTGIVSIGNATGGISLTGVTTSIGTIEGTTLYSSGDAGGIVNTNALTDVSVPVAGGTGAFTITSATTSGAATNAGFLKFYVGTTAVFVPYYTTTA